MLERHDHDPGVGPIRDAVIPRGAVRGPAPLPTPAQTRAVADLDDLAAGPAHPRRASRDRSSPPTRRRRDGRWGGMIDLGHQGLSARRRRRRPAARGAGHRGTRSAHGRPGRRGPGRDRRHDCGCRRRGPRVDRGRSPPRWQGPPQVMVGMSPAAGACRRRSSPSGRGWAAAGAAPPRVLGPRSDPCLCGRRPPRPGVPGRVLGLLRRRSASLLHVNVGAGELAAHIALRQGRLADVLTALHPAGTPRRGRWFTRACWRARPLRVGRCRRPCGWVATCVRCPNRGRGSRP